MEDLCKYEGMSNKLYVSMFALQPNEPKSDDLPYRNEVDFCKKWIIDNATMTKNIRSDYTSYTFKNFVEEDSIIITVEDGDEEKEGPYFYVSNGAFIQAAIELGYKYKQESPGSPNACFNMTCEYYSKDRVHNTNWIVDDEAMVVAN
jgi:hypothetical protein